MTSTPHESTLIELCLLVISVDLLAALASRRTIRENYYIISQNSMQTENATFFT